MSFNRENITWQSKDGSWSQGFYDHYATSQDGDDYDDEWDVEYTEDFHWVSTGHSDAEQARQSWTGPNPGTGSEISYSEHDAKAIDELDDKAAQVYLISKSTENSRLNKPAKYSGAPKERAINFIAKDLYKAKLEAAGYKLSGYSNMPDPRIPGWEDQLKKAERSKITAEENARVQALRDNYINSLKEKLHRFKQKLEIIGWLTPQAREAMNERMKHFNELRAEVEELEHPVTPQVAVDNKVPAKEVEASKGDDKKYHISPTTGRPNRCSATVRGCPFGDESDHYGTVEEAREAYEKSMGSGLSDHYGTMEEAREAYEKSMGSGLIGKTHSFGMGSGLSGQTHSFGDESDHYGTMEEAREAYEKSMGSGLSK